MDYAPYFYYIPDEGVDLEWGRGAAPGAHAIDFLYEAYNDEQFRNERARIYNKIVELADYLLSIQNVDETKLAYGGFKSRDDSIYYYSIDAMRCIPALLKAYDLTGSAKYFEAAELAATFLFNMQHKPSEEGVHDKYYGGFAQAVTIAGDWLVQMWIIDLYGLVGLRMLYERTKEEWYRKMMDDVLAFYREGFGNLYLYYFPEPYGDNAWHRVGTPQNLIYDDDFSYALYGLYSHEGYSSTVKRVYELINTIGSSPEYPEYNPQVCWSGYVDVILRKPACEYYDSVTAGILFPIRVAHDKVSLEVSVNKISENPESFMYWGIRFKDLSPVENKKATVTVSWLSLLFLRYAPIEWPPLVIGGCAPILFSLAIIAYTELTKKP